MLLVDQVITDKRHVSDIIDEWLETFDEWKKKTLIKRSNPIAKDLRTSKYQIRIIKNKKKEVKNDPRFDRRSILE